MSDGSTVKEVSGLMAAADDNVTSNSSSAPGLNNLAREIIVGVNMYVLPVVISLGIVGNTVSFVVFLASKLRHQSSSVYLAFLNFADCLFLLCLLVTHLEWYDVFLIRNDGMCQLVVYFSFISAFLSVWTVVSFTMERFIVVYYPLLRTVHCTRSKARKVVTSLLVFSLLLYSYSLWSVGLQKFPHGEHKECMTIRKHMTLMYVMSLVDSVVTMLVPTLVIVSVNGLIAWKIRRFMARKFSQREMSGTERSSRSVRSAMIVKSDEKGTSQGQRGHFTALPVVRSNSERYQLKTTQTLLTISSVFVLLNLPSHAFRMWATLHPQGDLPPEWLLLLQLVFQSLYYLNFSCNLIMYCACHRAFRTNLASGIVQVYRKLREFCQQCYMQAAELQIPSSSA